MDAERRRRRPGRNRTRRAPAFALALATSVPRSAAVSSSSSSLFAPAFASAPVRRGATTMRLPAKLDKLASTFDLDEILSNEQGFDAGVDAAIAGSAFAYKKRGRHRNDKKDDQKKKMKQQQRKQRLEREQLKQSRKEPSSHTSDQRDAWKTEIHGDIHDEPNIDHEGLIESLDFVAFEVPAHFKGKRIDAALVELLNQGLDAHDVAISRSQCGTLLSHDCVFLVPPEAPADALRAATEDAAAAALPRGLLARHGGAAAPVRRKAHPLEPSSVLLYPARASLRSASALLRVVPPTEIAAQDLPLDVLYEDEHMIVINKRAGMVVHPAAGNWDGTVVNALAYYLMNDSPFGAGEFFADGAAEEVGVGPDHDAHAANADADANRNDAVTNSVSALRPGIVHRLDKGTTGVLVVAKTTSALATLSEAFAARKVKKQYLAITIGNPGEDQWINKPIGRHPLHRQKMRVVPDPSSSVKTRGQARLSVAPAKPGRPALSHVHTVHSDGKLSVVQVRIATGRTHQIRVHLQDHGTPVYGDDVYGLSDWNKALSSQRGVTRPLLHAQRLEIDHPVTGESMVFKAPVADDMLGVMKAIMPADVLQRCSL